MKDRTKILGALYFLCAALDLVCVFVAPQIATKIIYGACAIMMGACGFVWFDMGRWW